MDELLREIIDNVHIDVLRDLCNSENLHVVRANLDNVSREIMVNSVRERLKSHKWLITRIVLTHCWHTGEIICIRFLRY